jgi:hypothetical protein
MTQHVIREVRVDPPVPADLVVLRRDEIERFIAAAYRTVARLESELELARIARAAPVITLPPWTDRPEDDPAAFFNSLRDDAGDPPLIAGTG